jgi:hypothetical protein
MYYIKQVEGELADAAKSIRAAVKAKDFDRAREIWRDVTGEDDKDESWFRYNAAHYIACRSGLTVNDWHLLYERCSDEEMRAKAAARLAERKVGGKWAVEYTY